MRNLQVLLILALSISSGCCRTFINVLEFPEPNSKGAQLFIQPGSNLSSGLGLCLRVKFNYFTMKPMVIIQNVLKLRMYDPKLQQGQLEVGTRKFIFNVTSADEIMAPLIWLTFCINLDQAQRSLSFAINKMSIFNVIDPGLGENLSLGNSISFGKGLTGQVTDLNIWNRPLQSQEIDQFQDCDASFGSESRILDWSKSNATFDPDVVITQQLLVEKVCKDGPKLKLFPHKMPFAAAFKTCHDLDGKMYLPLYDIRTIDSESLSTSCDGQLWIPVMRSEDNNWIKKKSIGDKNNATEVVDLGTVDNTESLDSCIVKSDPGYAVESCEAEHCFVCELNRSPVFKFRGHCASSEFFDAGYVMDLDEDLYYFRGFSGKRELIGNIGTKVSSDSKLKGLAVCYPCPPYTNFSGYPIVQEIF